MQEVLRWTTNDCLKYRLEVGYSEFYHDKETWWNKKINQETHVAVLRRCSSVN